MHTALHPDLLTPAFVTCSTAGNKRWGERRPGYKAMHDAATLISCPSHPSPLHTPLRTVVLHDDGKQGPVQGQQGATMGWQLQSPSCQGIPHQPGSVGYRITLWPQEASMLI